MLLRMLLRGMRSILRSLNPENERHSRPPDFQATPRAHKKTAAWVVRYTNDARRKAGLAPLKRYLKLQSVAQEHSFWMGWTIFHTRATWGPRLMCG